MLTPSMFSLVRHLAEVLGGLNMVWHILCLSGVQSQSLPYLGILWCCTFGGDFWCPVYFLVASQYVKPTLYHVVMCGEFILIFKTLFMDGGPFGRFLSLYHRGFN